LIRKRKGIRFGCDEGFYLKEKSYFTIGVDNNNEMLERASGKYDKLLNLDVQKRLPFGINILSFYLSFRSFGAFRKPIISKQF